MRMPEEWPLPLSLVKDEEASFSPRQEIRFKRIQDMDLDNRPSFHGLAYHIVENSDVPQRFYDDLVKWLEDGFRSLPDWREWLLKSKPADTEIPPVLEPVFMGAELEAFEEDDVEDDTEPEEIDEDDNDL